MMDMFYRNILIKASFDRIPNKESNQVIFFQHGILGINKKIKKR
jgi:hypothetical protein